MAGTREQSFTGIWEKVNYAEGGALRKVANRGTTTWNDYKCNPTIENLNLFNDALGAFHSAVLGIEARLQPVQQQAAPPPPAQETVSKRK